MRNNPLRTKAFNLVSEVASAVTGLLDRHHGEGFDHAEAAITTLTHNDAGVRQLQARGAWVEGCHAFGHTHTAVGIQAAAKALAVGSEGSCAAQSVVKRVAQREPMEDSKASYTKAVVVFAPPISVLNLLALVDALPTMVNTHALVGTTGTPASVTKRNSPKL